MAGLLGFLAAGAAKGTGAGIVAEAKAKREAAIAELEHTRLLSREQTDREFRSREGQLDRDFRASEGAKGRAASAEEGRLGRMETMTSADGTTLLRDGDTARPLKGEDGKPVKTLRTKGSEPADVQTAEWLIRNGVAKDAPDAWKRVSSAKDNPTARAKLVVDTYKSMKEADYSGERSDEDIREAARSMVDELIGQDGGTNAAPTAADPTSNAPRLSGADRDAAVTRAKQMIASGDYDPADVKAALRRAGITPDEAGL